MTLHVFSPDFVKQGIIRATKSTVWRESYRDRGTFTVVCVDTPENVRLLQIGWYYYRPEKNTAMMIVGIERNSEKSEITARGFTTTELIDRRVIYPTVFINGLLEQGIYNIINSNRPVPGLITAEPQGFLESHETQITGKEVLKTVQELSAINDWGFRTVFDWKNERHVFTLYKGEDRTRFNGDLPPVIASDRTGGLSDIEIEEDYSGFKNVAIVAGEGEGDDRTWVRIGAAIGIDAYEVFVDRRDLTSEGLTPAEYEALLTSAGMEELSETVAVFNFSAQPKTGPNISNVFDDTYFLGDKITCISKRYAIELDARIMASEEIFENNFIKTKLTIGQPRIRRWGR